jgi:hypothetical protein
VAEVGASLGGFEAALMIFSAGIHREERDLPAAGTTRILRGCR